MPHTSTIHRFGGIAPMAAGLILLLCLGAVFGAESRDDDAAKVTIKDLKFVPAKLTIKPGETVIWTNTDDNDHTVDFDDTEKKPRVKSGNLGNGDTFKHKFERPGKFPYSCSYHPRMKGIIIVTDRPAPAK
jgi:plastocyanin